MGSGKFRLQLNVLHATGSFSYSADDIWFDDKSISKFVNTDDIFNENYSVELNDLSKLFNLKIVKDIEYFILTVKIEEPIFQKDTKRIILETELDINYETLKAMQDTFRAYVQ